MDFQEFFTDAMNTSPVNGEEQAKKLLKKLNELLKDENVNSAQRDSIRCLAELIEENLDAIYSKNEEFFNGIAKITKELIFEEDEDIDLSELAGESKHAYKPLSGDEAELAKYASSCSVFLNHFSGERNKRLDTVVFDYMQIQGIDTPSNVWKPIGLGRKNWNNFLSRYNEPDSKASKLTMLQIAIGLRLNFEQTNEFLAHQGHRITKSPRDLIFAYYIINRTPFDKEKNHYDAAYEEANTVREKLRDGHHKTFPQVYE